MASGKKNYFRHSISAHRDPKLVALIDEAGKEAYFHYFTLLELCAEIACDEFPENGEFTFMRSSLCRELMVTPSRLTRHLMAIQSALLGHIVVTEKTVTCSFPNLRKYMGKYETKLPSNSPNKRKEKKNKEKEIIPPNPQGGDETDSVAVADIETKPSLRLADPLPDQNLPELAKIWNEHASPKLPRVRGIAPGGKRDKACRLRWAERPDRAYWQRVLEAINQSPHCLGENERGWKANIDFFTRPETHHKTLEGLYDKKLDFFDQCKAREDAWIAANPTAMVWENA